MFGSKKPPAGRRRPRAETQRAANAYTYRSHRQSSETPVRRGTGTSRPKPSFKWLHQLPTIVALVAIGGSLLYCLGLSTNPKIIQLSANQASYQELRSSHVYQVAAQKLLSRSLLNRSKLTIDTGAVSKSLKDQFPEISDVYISVPLVDRRPVISLRQATPKLLLTTANKSQTFVLDSNGRAIMLAQDLQKLGSFNLPTVLDQSNLTPKLNAIVLPQDNVAFIGEVLAQLQAKHLQAQTLTLPTGAEELQLHLTGVPYLVKFNMAEDPRQQAGTFLAVKGKLDADHVTPQQYVDVRVPERAYYK